VLSYALLAGLGMTFSRRFYPITLEWWRLARIVAAGVVSYGAATYALPGLMWSPVAVLLRGSTVIVVYAASLALTGFFLRTERERLAALWARIQGIRDRQRRGAGV
jgi:hypothetical protein